MSSAEQENHGEEKQDREYPLKTLKDFLLSNKYFIMRQFIGSDENVLFLKIYCESIGEPFLLYIPSKYFIRPEEGGSPITKIEDYDISEADLLSYYQGEEDKNNDSFNDIELDCLKDADSYAESQFKPIDLDNKNDYATRTKTIRYNRQLNKFKYCTSKSPYKFSILSNETLCVINRHNSVDNYLVRDSKNIISNIIDNSTNIITTIDHDFYIIIDLPSFYDKINNVPDDILKIQKTFYGIISKIHTTQTKIAQHKLQYSQFYLAGLNSTYIQKSKLLTEIDKLNAIITLSLDKERQLYDTIVILKTAATNSTSTSTGDSDRVFKIKKNEEELKKTREVKKKTAELLTEIKRKWNNFLLNYDTAIFKSCESLATIETEMKTIGITQVKNSK